VSAVFDSRLGFVDRGLWAPTNPTTPYQPHEFVNKGLGVQFVDKGLWARVLQSSGRGTAKAEEAQGTPTQSRISQSALVYEHKAIRAPPDPAATGAIGPAPPLEFGFGVWGLRFRVGG